MYLVCWWRIISNWRNHTVYLHEFKTEKFPAEKSWKFMKKDMITTSETISSHWNNTATVVLMAKGEKERNGRFISPIAFLYVLKSKWEFCFTAYWSSPFLLQTYIQGSRVGIWTTHCVICWDLVTWHISCLFLFCCFCLFRGTAQVFILVYKNQKICSCKLMSHLVKQQECNVTE